MRGLDHLITPDILWYRPLNALILPKIAARGGQGLDNLPTLDPARCASAVAGSFRLGCPTMGQEPLRRQHYIAIICSRPLRCIGRRCA